MFSYVGPRHLRLLSACVLVGALSSCTPTSDPGGDSGTGGSTSASGGRGGSAGSQSGSGGSSASGGSASGGSGSGGSASGGSGSGGDSGTGGSGSGGSASGGSGEAGSSGSGGQSATGGTAGTGDAAVPPADSVSSDPGGPFPAGPHKVVLITGDVAHPNDPSRVEMIAVLNSMKDSHGVVLEEIAANKVVAAEMMDKALLIAGPNANYFSVEPDPALKSLPVPIMVSKDGKTDGYGIGTTGNTDANLNKITIVKSDHPLAAGLPAGVVTVLTTPSAQRLVTYSNLGPDAIKIATGPNASTWSLIGYEKGGDMGNGNKAPARRVGFYWHRPAGPTADGKKLFQAAVEWCLRSPK
jgi:hypothetical protein